VYDSLGSAHTATTYFIKDAAVNTWNLQVEIDGTPVGGVNQITFANDGSFSTPAGGLLSLPGYTPTTGAADITMSMDLSSATQFGDAFGVNSLSQDGFTTGRLTGVSVDTEGVVFARFTNGQSTSLGKLALANFVNQQGLQQLGDTTWGQSFSSGDALLGEAGTASFGSVQSGALEASNVDLTAQLVQMITAQRNFQANAQMISTADTVTQTVINIR
jgi:flagellar hook protein FlgE